jgi:hypothetical protein
VLLAAQRRRGRAATIRTLGSIGSTGFLTAARGSTALVRRAALDTGEEDPALLRGSACRLRCSWRRRPRQHHCGECRLEPRHARRDGRRSAAQASEDDNYDPKSLVDVEGARRAVEGGLRFGQRMLGLEAHHAAVPGAVQPDGNALKGLAHGVGAASPEELQASTRPLTQRASYPRSCARSRAINAQYQFWNKMRRAAGRQTGQHGLCSVQRSALLASTARQRSPSKTRRSALRSLLRATTGSCLTATR